MMEFWKSEHAVAGIRHCENRHLACSGTTLVELMVATLIGVIVFTSWLSICNPKPVVRESYRRLAVEQATGYLDMMAGGLRAKKPNGQDDIITDEKSYEVKFTNGVYSLHKRAPSSDNKKNVWPVFPGESGVPVGYTLCVEKKNLGAESGWPNDSYWAVARLYDAVDVPEGDAGRPFCELKVFLK